jgi:YVTN family beta-propeller protein
MNLHSMQWLKSRLPKAALLDPLRVKVFCSGLFLLTLGASGARAQAPVKTSPEQTKAETPAAKAISQIVTPQKIVQQGIAVEFTVDPQIEKPGKLRVGEDSVVKIKVTDTTTGTPVKGLNLSVWMSLRAGDNPPDAKECHDRIQSFIGGTLRERPDVDLNSYYILALNQSPDISVIDPLLGFGGSKLLALVMLKSPGEDWALSRDRERLFVTMPLINQVAVVDTRTWKVSSYIDVGVKPTRIILQPDQKYLWVANDGNLQDASGVSVIDAATLKVAAQISTGTGHHETVISSDNRFAFVSNRESGTISVIDVRQLQKINDIKVSSNPVSMALSELSRAIYVASETEGSITVIDEQSQRILTQMKAKPGLRSIRLAPDGRYGFAINTKENTVNIFDTASNGLLHEVKVGKAPDQVMFSDTFAFIRSLSTESVSMIRLATLGKDVEITDFPGGQKVPDTASAPVRADSIVLAPEGNAVIVANPADKVIYYYAEGMAAPMGDFDNYRREPRAVLVVDRSLRETSPGLYSAMVKFPASGMYDVAFLADAPRIAHCFEAAAEPNPLLKKESQVALRLEHLIKEMKLPVGQDFSLRFKLIETTTNRAKDNLKDVRVLIYSGAWQRRDIAKSLGGGLYEITLNVPEPGTYSVFVESFSMGVRYQDLPQLMLQATDEKTDQANVARKP